MNELWQIVAGVVIGVLVAAPIGPVNVICIQRTMQSGPGSAFLVGLGAAVGDSLFGALAALGLASISRALIAHQAWFEMVGGVILIAMGFYAWRSHPHLDDPVPTTGDLARGALATFTLTISNPITALGFVALFTSAGVGRTGDHGEALRLVLGVFAGSALWWATITRLSAMVRDRMNDTHLWWINRGSAVIVWGFGAVSLVKAALESGWFSG
ncbi:MAG: LysE family translocator [Alphaproteobacteria bacterium]|nr:MAG: LysE family translocator [Alphaproteobacteria bacterium]